MKAVFDVILNDITFYLDENLPEYLSYHNTAHTLYVLEKAIHIGKKEKITHNDLELIKVAALFHDIGFVKSHIEHEKESCIIAESFLHNYGYSTKDINSICGMIMATKIPQKPKSLLEKIVADADLEYLGTSKYLTISQSLFKELKFFNRELTHNEWCQIQIDFFKNHKYHTTYCKHYKKFRKLRNLNLLKSQL